MDSSAFQVVLIPVCQGVCYGFIVGTLIRFARSKAYHANRAAPSTPGPTPAARGMAPIPQLNPNQNPTLSALQDALNSLTPLCGVSPPTPQRGLP